MSAGLWKSLRADIRLLCRAHRGRMKRALVVCTNRGMQAVFLYRVSHTLWKHRIPALPMLISRFVQHLYAVDIDYRAEIGPGLVLVHCFGTVIGNGVRIEGDCCIYHGVTLGNRGSEWVGSDRTDGHPAVETGCILGAGAKILGPIRVGRSTVVGANSVVLADLPPNTIAAGVPARVVGVRPAMDENLRRIDQQSGDLLPSAS
jgi:serine O-acetyltransferase